MPATAPIIRFPLFAALAFSLLSLGLDANRKPSPASPATQAAATQATEVPPDVTAVRQVLHRVAAALPDLTAVSIQRDRYPIMDGGDTAVEADFSLTAQPHLKDKTGRYYPDLHVSIQSYKSPSAATAGLSARFRQMGDDGDELYNGIHLSRMRSMNYIQFQLQRHVVDINYSDRISESLCRNFWDSLMGELTAPENSPARATTAAIAAATTQYSHAHPTPRSTGHNLDDISTSLFGIKGEIIDIDSDSQTLRSIRLNVIEPLDTATPWKPYTKPDESVTIRFDEPKSNFATFKLSIGDKLRVYFGNIDYTPHWGSNSSWIAVQYQDFYDIHGKPIDPDNDTSLPFP